MIRFNLVLTLVVALFAFNACQKLDKESTSPELPLGAYEEAASLRSNANGATSTTAPNTFALVNAETHKDIESIGEGGVINLAQLSTRKLNVRFNTETATVGSVVFVLSGEQKKTTIENAAPYTLFGDHNGRYFSWTPRTGTYTLKATVFPKNGGSGTVGKSITVTFEVIDDASESQFGDGNNTDSENSFTLINADSNKEIAAIKNGETIDLSKLPTTKLNIRANVDPAGVGSVVFKLTGAETKQIVEGVAPYALFGDNSGNYNPWTPKAGSYSLEAKIYSGPNGTGTTKGTMSIQFSVASSGAVVQPPGQKPGDSKLLVYSDFETIESLNRWGKELSRPTNITLSNDVSRKGRTAVKFEFTRDDTKKGGLRAELKLNHELDKERWYGMSHFLPSDWARDPQPEIVSQWHSSPDLHLGEGWISPPLGLNIRNDRYYVIVLWDSKKVTPQGQWQGKKEFDLGPVEKNKWVDWVFHINWSYNSDGVLEIWKNKQKVVNYRGPIGFNDEKYPYFKMGIYKWGWYGWAHESTTHKRVLYIDEVRIGDRNSSFDAVSPQ